MIGLFALTILFIILAFIAAVCCLLSYASDDSVDHAAWRGFSFCFFYSCVGAITTFHFGSWMWLAFIINIVILIIAYRKAITLTD
jgi:hypothetical protein